MNLTRLFVLRAEENARELYAFLKANWRAMAADDKFLAVLVTEYKSKRTLEQNSRYFAILETIGAQAWVDGKQFSKNAWHEHFARKYIGVERLPNGETVAVSTTTLNVEKFGEYMDSVMEYAMLELGVRLDEIHA